MPSLEQQLLGACYNFDEKSEEDVLKTVKELMRKGAAVNAQNKSNEKTALHYAVTNKLETVVEYLLSNKASPVFVDGQGQTVLHCAVLSGSSKMVQLLLKKRVMSLYKENNGKKTPLDLAFQEGNQEIIMLFLQSPDFDANREHLGIVSKLTISTIHAHFAKDAQNIISQLQKKGFSLPDAPREVRTAMPSRQRPEKDMAQSLPSSPADTTPFIETQEAQPQRTWRCARIIVPFVVSSIVALALSYGIYVWYGKKQSKPDAALPKVDEEYKDEETVAWLYDEQLQEEAKE